MKKKRQNPIEVPMGYPAIDPSMAWSAAPEEGMAGAMPGAGAGPYGDPYYQDPTLYADSATYYAEPVPYAESTSYAEPTPYAEGMAYGAGPYGDAGYGGAPAYPPLDGAPDPDDDGSSRGPLKVLLIVLGIIVAAVLVIVGTNVYTVSTTRDSVHRVSTFYQQDVDAIVVLGASVFADGTPSDILADRLEVAADLYKAGAGREIIVSGDNADSHYNESDAMRDYLVELGVPEDKIVVDRLGTDTYASMYRAKNAFGANRVIVVTQAYHLYRALMIAEGLGMEAGGVAADKGDYDDQMGYSLREVLARTKDCLLTLIQLPVSTSTR